MQRVPCLLAGMPDRSNADPNDFVHKLPLMVFREKLKTLRGDSNSATPMSPVAWNQHMCEGFSPSRCLRHLRIFVRRQQTGELSCGVHPLAGRPGRFVSAGSHYV